MFPWDLCGYTGPPGNLSQDPSVNHSCQVPFTVAVKTYAGTRTQTSLGVILPPANEVTPPKALEWRRAFQAEGATGVRAPKLEQIRHVLRTARTHYSVLPAPSAPIIIAS